MRFRPWKMLFSQISVNRVLVAALWVGGAIVMFMCVIGIVLSVVLDYFF